MGKINLFWFRRDLRLHDNAALYHALKARNPVLPVFIFDTNILQYLEDKNDARVTFIFDTLLEINASLKKQKSQLLVKYGEPLQVWKQLLAQYDIHCVYANHNYEPYTIDRDQKVEALLKASGVLFKTFKDQVIFEKGEILKKDGNPYTVFTPYSRKWKAKLNSFYLKSYPCEKYHQYFMEASLLEMPSLESMGFLRSTLSIPSPIVQQEIIKNYDKTRNFPSMMGTSRLGIHFRFGTISIREKARKAALLNEIYLNELIWREFYAMILFHFPQVLTNSFRPKYDRIEWRNNEKEFEFWREGKTGYPLVDAGMRELNTTGYMHNRVRMIAASFLTKHLLIDWRWGEAYFARKLLDFDLASNNGGWQWAAGSGTDAAPYFRIFSPEAQLKKFDKNMIYVKKWVPEYGTMKYPKPIVEHKFARERCLKAYKEALN